MCRAKKFSRRKSRRNLCHGYGGSMSSRNAGIHVLKIQNNTTLINLQCRAKIEVQYIAYLER
jgi:hypothetical protein